MKQQNLEISKKLKAICIFIYSAVLLALIALIIVIAIQDHNTFKEKALAKTITIEGTAVGNVFVQGNNNTINVNIVPAKEYRTWANNIASLSKKELCEVDAKSFDTDKIAHLISLITNAAQEIGMDYDTAFLIVAIESSFKEEATNTSGAVGLCQVMESGALADWNKYHSIQYTIEDMKDSVKNLRVGLWYYQFILSHYDEHYCFIDETSTRTKLRDAYIAYNYGVTNFYLVGSKGRWELRNGRYPDVRGTKANNFGAKVGSAYRPMQRFNRLYDEWCSLI